MIRVQFNTVQDNGSTTVGIEGPDGIDGIQTLYNGSPIVVPPGRPNLITDGYVVEYRMPRPPDCDNAIPIACGETIPSSTSPTQTSPAADVYGCGGGAMLAYERVFTFTLNELSWLRADLMTANDLKNNKLMPGDVLKLPAGAVMKPDVAAGKDEKPRNK